MNYISNVERQTTHFMSKKYDFFNKKINLKMPKRCTIICLLFHKWDNNNLQTFYRLPHVDFRLLRPADRLLLGLRSRGSVLLQEGLREGGG